MASGWTGPLRYCTPDEVAALARKLARRVRGYAADDTIVFLRHDSPGQPMPGAGSGNRSNDVSLLQANNPHFLALCEQFPAKRFDLRLQDSGKQCLGVLVHGELAGYGWLARHSCMVDEINCRLSLSEGDIYIHDCFIFPAFRRRGLYAALLAAIASGVERSFIGCSLHNAGSLRVIRSAGFVEYERIQYRRTNRTERWLHTHRSGQPGTPVVVIPAATSCHDVSTLRLYPSDTPPFAP